MKKLCAGLVIMLFFSCSQKTHVSQFLEPTDSNTMLVVGRVVIEDNLRSGRMDVLKKGIDVAILGRSENGEQLSYWAETDENGYFVLSNVPVGDYTIKGWRTYLWDGSIAAVVNPLKQGRNYFINNVNGEYIIFDGDYFAFQATGRVLSLKQNYFSLNPQVTSSHGVQWKVVQNFDNFKMVTGEKFDAGQVEPYFMQKYPDSAWNDQLAASADKDNVPRDGSIYFYKLGK